MWRVMATTCNLELLGGVLSKCVAFLRGQVQLVVLRERFGFLCGQVCLVVLSQRLDAAGLGGAHRE